MKEVKVRRLKKEKDILRSTLKKREAWDLGGSSVKFKSKK